MKSSRGFGLENRVFSEFCKSFLTVGKDEMMRVMSAAASRTAAVRSGGERKVRTPFPFRRNHAQWVTPTAIAVTLWQGKCHRDNTILSLSGDWRKVKSLPRRILLYQLISKISNYGSSSSVTAKDGKPCVVQGRTAAAWQRSGCRLILAETPGLDK